jgi:hypothetical protein
MPVSREPSDVLLWHTEPLGWSLSGCHPVPATSSTDLQDPQPPQLLLAVCPQMAATQMGPAPAHNPPCAPLPRFSLFPPLSFSPLFLSSFPLSLFPSSLSSLHLNQLKCSLILINVTPLLGDGWNIYLGVWGLSPFCPLLKA